jgi:hypothetical protein
MGSIFGLFVDVEIASLCSNALNTPSWGGRGGLIGLFVGTETSEFNLI